MKQSTNTAPDPTAQAALLWLKQLDRQQLHDAGWVEVNKRFHGLARAARPFINEHFETPGQQQAAFDGFTLALISLARFSDIAQLSLISKDNTTHKNPKIRQ